MEHHRLLSPDRLVVWAFFILCAAVLKGSPWEAKGSTGSILQKGLQFFWSLWGTPSQIPLPCGTRSSRFTCRCSLFLPGIRLGRSGGASVLRTGQSCHLCNPRGRLVYSLANHASAYDAASIVALCITRALYLRYWIGVRDQEGVITAGRTNLALPTISSLP